MYLYYNVYQARNGKQFCGLSHVTRESLEYAAYQELAREPNTIRVGILRVKTFK